MSFVSHFYTKNEEKDPEEALFGLQSHPTPIFKIYFPKKV